MGPELGFVELEAALCEELGLGAHLRPSHPVERHVFSGPALGPASLPQHWKCCGGLEPWGLQGKWGVPGAAELAVLVSLGHPGLV